MLKPKVGDMVRLKPLEVREAYPSVGVYLGGMTVLAYDQEIEEILPRPLAVGDRVRVDNCGAYARLLATHNGYGWVEGASGGFRTLSLSALSRINDPS